MCVLVCGVRGAQCYVLIHQAWLSFFLRYAPEEAKALLSGFIADSKNLPKLEYAEGRVGGSSDQIADQADALVDVYVDGEGGVWEVWEVWEMCVCVCVCVCVSCVLCVCTVLCVYYGNVVCTCV